MVRAKADARASALSLLPSLVDADSFANTATLCSSSDAVFSSTAMALTVVVAAPHVSRMVQMMLQLPADGSHVRLALTVALPSATELVSVTPMEMSEYAKAYSSGKSSASSVHCTAVIVISLDRAV
eukprot:6090828-Prymnesium_polylepis.2